jgi:hypothetical protein
MLLKTQGRPKNEPKTNPNEPKNEASHVVENKRAPKSKPEGNLEINIRRFTSQAGFPDALFVPCRLWTLISFSHELMAAAHSAITLLAVISSLA